MYTKMRSETVQSLFFYPTLPSSPVDTGTGTEGVTRCRGRIECLPVHIMHT